LRIGALNPHHPCWRFVVFAGVVFVSSSCWSSLASQSPLGRAKRRRGAGVFPVGIALFILFLNSLNYSFA